MDSLHNSHLNKTYSLNKLLLFPYGMIIVMGPIYGALFGAYHFIFEYDPLLPIGKIAVMIFIFLIVLSGYLYLNYFPQRSKDKTIKVYLFIVAEDWTYDHYISEDLLENMRSYFEKDNVGWDVKIPNIYYRYHFCQRIKRQSKRNRDYLESKPWFRLHKMLGGSFYLVGELRKQTTKGEEHLKFTQMRMVVAHNSKLIAEQRYALKSAMVRNSASNIFLNKKYEFEHLDILSKDFVFLIEFVVGLARYMSGDVISAYNLHGKLVKYKRVVSVNKQLCADANYYLGQELSSILQSYFATQDFHNAERQLEMHRREFGDSISTRINEAHILIRKSNSIEECRRNARIALSLLEGISIEKETDRAVILLNKGYLFLLIRDYENAEKAYHAALKYASNAEYTSVLEYCITILNNPKKTFEHEVALFVKAYALYRMRSDDAKETLLKVLETNSKNSYFGSTAQSILELM